jgi:hypothetical protein
MLPECIDNSLAVSKVRIDVRYIEFESTARRFNPANLAVAVLRSVANGFAVFDYDASVQPRRED